LTSRCMMLILKRQSVKL